MSTIRAKGNPRDIAVDRIITQLENNPGLWKKTWQKIGVPSNRPFNPFTKIQYSGMNMLTLALTAEECDFTDNRWASYEQARIAGFPVKRGEQSKAIVVYHQIIHSIKIDNNIYKLKSKSEATAINEMNIMLQKNFPAQATQLEKICDELSLKLQLPRSFNCARFSEQIKKQLNLNFEHHVETVAKATHVFNFSQLENTIKLTENTQKWDPIEDAENIIKSSGVKIFHDQYDNNFYRPGFHEIHLTIKSSFKSTEAYYSTVLHELSHAKINDGTINLSFDPNDYSTQKTVQAKEELRAELSSIFICANIGLNYDVQNHAAYLQSWLSSFKNDKNELWSAISEAGRVSEAILKQNSNKIFVNTPGVDLIPLEGYSLQINDNTYQVNIPTQFQHPSFLSTFIAFMGKPNSIVNYKNYSNELLKLPESQLPKERCFYLSGDGSVPPKITQEVLLNDNQYLNNEFELSIERGVDSTKSRLPPLFTASLYSKVLNELELVLQELRDTEPELLLNKVKAYVEMNSDSLVSTVISEITNPSQINSTEVIAQINHKCYEIINTQNQTVIKHEENLIKGIKI